jgi:hypothetical protein
MGFFDWISGSRGAPDGVARQTSETLRHAMLAINRPTAPFRVRDGGPEGVDLVAEWRIVDARWYEIFAKANLTRVFSVLMRFDESRGEVRAVDQEWAVQWRAGVPTLGASTEAFRGQKIEMSFGGAYAFKEDLSGWGKVYQYRFRTSELKDPLIEVAQANGWGWKGVAFGKL